ncbi:uncharacterized protein PG998_005457 [Apiospora kogelbergensis]|uniref:uncharacterized protein n=1 Tax=Apiospora kogelbergensis TaxID=1337665 RepID=UPI00312F7DDF
MAPTPTIEERNVGENDAFAGPTPSNSTASSGEKPAASSLTPWVIVVITAASFLAVTFLGYVAVCLMRRRRHRQRVGAAADAVKRHNCNYYRQSHSREGSFERPWPSPHKSHYYNTQPQDAVELQRSHLISKSRASRESWSSYGGSVMVADDTIHPRQQNGSFSKPHDYTAVSANDDHQHQHPNPNQHQHSTSTATTSTMGRGTRVAARRNQEQYGYAHTNDDSDSEEEYEPHKRSMSSGDWKELEATGGRLRSSSLQDPATQGRGHPAFSPELQQQAQLPARLPRALATRRPSP